MKHTTFYIFLILLFASLALSAQTENMVYPQNYDTKFQDVYVDANGHGFAVGTCGVVIRTTNDGMTWELVAISASSFDYSAVTCPNDDCDDAIIAGDAIVLNRQSNGSFSMDVREDFREVRMFHELDNNVLIADKNGQDYLRSVDNGATWAAKNIDADWQSTFMTFVDDSNGFVFDGDKYLHKTTDGGATWTRNPNPFGLNAYAIHWYDTDTGWMQATDRKLYKTTDGGQSWTDLNVSSGPNRLLWIESFSESHIIAVGLVEEIWESIDGGANWNRTFFPSESGTRPNFYNYHRRGDEFFVPSDAAEVFYSAADFANWEGLVPRDRLGLTHVAFANDNIGVAGGITSALLKTTDGGNTWSPLVSGNPNGNAPISAIDMRSTTEFVLYYGNTYPRITEDGGSSFTEYFGATSGLGQGDVNVFHNFDNGDIFVMGYEKGGLSTNGGASWSVFSHGFDTRINDVHFPTSSIGYLAGDRLLAKTTDGGQTWTEINNPATSARWQSVYFFDENRGVIGQSSRTGYLTTDGGVTWTKKEEASAGEQFAYDEVNDILYSSTFESGNNGYINRTLDQGESWQRVSKYCAAGGGVGITPSGNFVYAVGTGGHIERHESSGITSNRQQQRTALQLQAFPNPTAGAITVDLPAANRSTSLDVFAADGRRVQTMVVPAQTERLEISLDGEPAGLYLFSWVSSTGIRHTGRIILR